MVLSVSRNVASTPSVRWSGNARATATIRADLIRSWAMPFAAIITISPSTSSKFSSSPRMPASIMRAISSTVNARRRNTSDAPGTAVVMAFGISEVLPAAVLEPHAFGAREAVNFARLLGRGDRIAKLLDQAAHLGSLLGIALGQLAAPDVEAVLQTDAHIAAHHHCLGGKWNLHAAGPQHGPLVIVAEQFVGGAFHEHEVVDVAADAAQNSKDELQEDRRLEQAAIDAVCEIVEVPGIVALVLEFGPVALAHELRNLLDVAEGIAEDVLIGGEKI